MTTSFSCRQRSLNIIKKKRKYSLGLFEITNEIQRFHRETTKHFLTESKAVNYEIVIVGQCYL